VRSVFLDRLLAKLKRLAGVSDEEKKSRDIHSRTFNRMFQEQLAMVMTFDKIKEKIKYYPVHITRVII
jgi:acetate kinase